MQRIADGSSLSSPASTEEAYIDSFALAELGDWVDYATGEYPGEGGVPIFFQRWLPQGMDLRGVVVIVHGLGEHGGRYLNLVRRLLPDGFVLYANDHRGFGQSGGERGHVERFHDYLADLRQMVIRAREAYPALPVALFAHSMGGLIGIRYLQTFGETVDMAVISAPALGVRQERASRSLIAMMRIMSRLRPTFAIDNRGSEPVSRDPDVIAAFDVDPFNTRWVTARWATEMLDAQADLAEEMDRLTMPILLLQGLADRLVIPELTQAFYRQIPAEDRTIYLYPGYYHELINDLGKEIPLDELAQWLIDRV